jgi:hypothetical protein
MGMSAFAYGADQARRRTAKYYLLLAVLALTVSRNTRDRLFFVVLEVAAHAAKNHAAPADLLFRAAHTAAHYTATALDGEPFFQANVSNFLSAE